MVVPAEACLMLRAHELVNWPVRLLTADFIFDSRYTKLRTQLSYFLFTSTLRINIYITGLHA
jgi:hypothetical protein